MKIMIVDDHADMRRVLRNIVSLSTPAHVEIFECESGEEAIGKYTLLNPDCVLMDVELTGINGFGTIEKIYSQDPHAKVVVVTSHDTLSFRKRAEKLQVKGFITKDNLTDLNQVLQTITSK